MLYTFYTLMNINRQLGGMEHQRVTSIRKKMNIEIVVIVFNSIS